MVQFFSRLGEMRYERHEVVKKEIRSNFVVFIQSFMENKTTALLVFFSIVSVAAISGAIGQNSLVLPAMSATVNAVSEILSRYNNSFTNLSPKITENLQFSSFFFNGLNNGVYENSRMQNKSKGCGALGCDQITVINIKVLNELKIKSINFTDEIYHVVIPV
jgi:hypothetical protein